MRSAEPPRGIVGTLIGANVVAGCAGATIAMGTGIVDCTVDGGVGVIKARAGEVVVVVAPGRDGAIVAIDIWPTATVTTGDGATVVVAALPIVVVVARGTVVVGEGAVVVVGEGAVVVVGVGAESIVTDEALTPDTGPVMPDADTASAAIRATTVPSDAHTTDTVTLEPDELDGVNTHPVAVPVLEKSPAATPVTLLLNTNVYDNVRDADGDDGSVHDTVGTTRTFAPSESNFDTKTS